METKNRIHHLYIDIETWAGDNKPSLDDIKAPANYKDADKIKAYKEENLDSAYRKQALDSMKGEIICIGYAVDDEPVNAIIRNDSDSEAELIDFFDEVVASISYPVFVGHNLKRFDLLWLWHRAVKYKLDTLRAALPHKNKSNKADIIDTMEEFSVLSYGSDAWYSLDELCKFLGIAGKGDMSGDKVHDAYLNKEYDKIIQYCKEDVERVRQIHKLIS